MALTTREFGEWAKVAWPALSDAVLTELQRLVDVERPQQLVEGRPVAARDDARRHRADRRGPLHPISGATSPKVSPGRITARVPRPSWVTAASPERRT